MLTAQQGVPVDDDQNTRRNGPQGPCLREDFHFDHERIPERVMRARGFGPHGFLETTKSLADITRADLFRRAGQRTRLRPLLDGRRQQGFGRPRARHARLRGEALHEEGNWDLVGNNIPVFVIQDTMQFP